MSESRVKEQGLTQKQRAFIMAVVGDNDTGSPMTLADAYRYAYDVKTMSANAVRVEACKLYAKLADNPNVAIMQSEYVAAMRQKMQASQVARQLTDSERVLDMLRSTMDSADTSPNIMARLKSAELLGKANGLFIERQHTETIDRTAQDVMAELERRLSAASEQQGSSVEAATTIAGSADDDGTRH